MNGDSASSLTTPPTCSTTATSSSPVGNYVELVLGAVDANYAITYVGGSVERQPGDPHDHRVVAVGDLRRRRPDHHRELLGLRERRHAGSLTTPPTCSTTAASGSPAGSYPTSCSGAVDANYSISYLAGTATVDQAPLVVTASSASHHLRRCGAHHHGLVLGLRER